MGVHAIRSRAVNNGTCIVDDTFVVGFESDPYPMEFRLRAMVQKKMVICSRREVNPPVQLPNQPSVLAGPFLSVNEVRYPPFSV